MIYKALPPLTNIYATVNKCTNMQKNAQFHTLKQQKTSVVTLAFMQNISLSSAFRKTKTTFINNTAR